MTNSGPMSGGGLLVVGDVVTDVVARHATALVHGTDTSARIRTLPGGAGANVACWAARSGCRDVRLLARVGADRAVWHRDALRRAGVRCLLAVDDDVPTATVVALVDAAAERTFLTDSGAVLRLSPGDWSPSMLDGIAHLHLSGYLLFAATSRATALLALREARRRGVTVSVDPASAGFLAELGVDRFLTAVEGTDLLLPNADEARLLTGLPEPADAAAKLSLQVPRVVVTLGEDGVLLAVAGTVTRRIPAVQVRGAVDSTGAGDAFTGGFLAAHLAGADDTSALAAGCRSGAEAVTTVGGRPGP
ncbi:MULTISPECIES: carbohydrate kinase family protein [unclassified Streptomyces]|uniref:carbohydrate kinase family protein n=1 Tax=unclassified Streptomyces TaxID=2593676 RepID=UPI00225134EB|nr:MULTISPECIES: sugar kinase [unclassified Streptomyces]WSP59949.1 sugar kinase [Streptomyces sp. NBC_01241]WSU26637.1 sugar kinase [Streptomyces sp. NBC_01108]MCX4786014.1 sugar kinase [Streptomyces sp. NBC_01221]MCX4798129.1 sugar kinase [Streptomyces sp. NBC_01242]WSP67563.1 sugar kinase [Streptomyces sp. NBC_01240]